MVITQKGSEAGSALVESIISLTLLIFFTVALGQTGRLLGEITSVSQIAYQVALIGSETPQARGSEIMSNMHFLLREIQDDRMSRLEPQWEWDGAFEPYNSTEKTVHVPLDGEVSPLFQAPLGLINMELSYKAPLLLMNAFDTVDNLDEFEDPECDYDCDGNPVVGCHGAVGVCPGTIPDGGGGPHGCFSAGTPITMEDGSQKPIELIKKGDRVAAFDPETGKQITSSVVELMPERYSDDFYLLNGHIKVTGEHPFYVDGNWVKVADLQLGDTLTTVTGEKISLNSKEKTGQRMRIYNFEVSGVHNYYAAGILVHNKSLPVYDGGMIAD